MAHLRLLPAIRREDFAAPDARAETGARWGLEELRGRLAEISGVAGAATLTAAFDLVLEAQLAGEPVGWIMAPAADSFYVQDVVDSGVDLAALLVVRVDAERMAKVASRMLQSGGFGLVVIDLHGDACGELVDDDAQDDERPERALTAAVQLELSLGQQGKLAGLAKRHEAAVVCLSPRPADAPALSSLISLRVEATHGEDAAGNEQVRLHALKDKHRGPGWRHTIELVQRSLIPGGDVLRAERARPERGVVDPATERDLRPVGGQLR
jgi:recombination protein RecA